MWQCKPTCFRRLLPTLGLLLALVALGAPLPVLAAGPERPLVFIPGILGSRLVDASGRVVWGERNSLLNYTELELKPDVATPFQADGLVKAINVLGPFWTVHQYDSLLENLRKLGYVDGHTLFVFPYDWRQSNFDSASKFATYVNATPALRGAKFDVLMHSMGGLVGKIWMLEHDGAQRVRKAIFLGTPFQGSMNALGTLSAGWGPFANAMAGGLDAVRRVSMSFPGLIELLPRYDKCCRLGDQRQHAFLDILNADTWTNRDWLPSEHRSGARNSAFLKNLERARRLDALMHRDLSGVQELKFAGDVIDTKLWLYVPREKQGWKDWIFTLSRGDGTVPVWSAVNDFRSTEGTNPSFVEHATIFTDKWVANRLAREFVSDAPPPVNREDFRDLGLDLVSVALESSMATPGATIALFITLEFNTAVTRGRITPDATSYAQQAPISLMETTTADDEALRRLTFRGTVTAPQEENTHRIDVRIPGAGTRSIYLTVLAAR